MADSGKVRQACYDPTMLGRTPAVLLLAALWLAPGGCSDESPPGTIAPSGAVDAGSADGAAVALDAATPEGDAPADAPSGRVDPTLIGAFALLCAPCRESDDCDGGTCFDFGKEGRFCAVPCGDGLCPAGHACQTVAGGDFCLPVDGTCDCSPKAAVLGATTVCIVSASGTLCEGTRRCTPAGLSPCSIPPGTERCNGADDDCDGLTDEDFGVGQPCSVRRGACSVAGVLQCTADGSGAECAATGSGGQIERCNGVDDDCDGLTDEDFALGQPCQAAGGACGGAGVTVCAADGAGVACSGIPGQAKPESCNGVDDDCNGETDEGCDDDQDGWCDDAMGFSGSPAVCPQGGGDCDDTAAAIHPGAMEDCGTPADDDCSGAPNQEGATGCSAFYRDADGDGYGDAEHTVCACGPLGEYTATQAGDCDDSTGAVHPTAEEVCDGLDNDCDQQTDGMTEACTGACGPGIRTCTAGVFGACSGAAQLCAPADPCCRSDGCGFQPSSTKCGTAPEATRTVCSGSCGGKVVKEEQLRYCDGKSSGCGAGHLQWDPAGTVQACGAGDLCQASGSAATCKACGNGCTGGQCIDQPTRTICIDPGYGGTEPGPVHNGLQGQDVTWSLAQHLKTWLESDTAQPAGGGTWKVVLTRTASTGPTSAQRAATCNAASADRVIAIFVNACCGNSATGVETYHYTTASATTKTWAGLVQSQAVALGGLKDRGVKTGTFTIVKDTAAPACITFLGFLDNTSDAAKLGNDAWRKTVAKGFLHAIQTSLGYAEYTP